MPGRTRGDKVRLRRERVKGKHSLWEARTRVLVRGSGWRAVWELKGMGASL